MTPRARAWSLLPLVAPALVIGVGASLLLFGVSKLADLLKGVLWETLPDAVGLGPYSVPWILIVLTATGVAVGLVVWKVHGHAGPDPATTGLVDAPLPLGVLPGLLLAAVLALAGGVSLGPENPITAANIALAYWLGNRLKRGSPPVLWVMLAAAATIGALFGTPVAAALVLSEFVADADRPADGLTLWDRLFAPLVAAGAGGLTTLLLEQPTFALPLPDLGRPGWGDLLAALVVASVGAVLGMAAVYAFPYTHRIFYRLRHPVLIVTAGGVVLGLLGALGGQLTLFKGLEETGELVESASSYGWGALLGMAVVKMVALTVASTSGFRGGRIFPSVFVGVALGLAAHALVPAVSPTVGVTCAVLGVVVAATRNGWLSLFAAAMLAPASIGLLPLLCLAVLPAWLICTGRPLMQLPPVAVAGPSEAPPKAGPPKEGPVGRT
ncbi:ion channel protein [Streptomyces sp. APSN-46.1]|nr:ion channel protein [Streptomyces sp. APSN-46.1]MCJ1675876.1 ion channel protein [Streptomyces sp. APSN-46.1]